MDDVRGPGSGRRLDRKVQVSQAEEPVPADADSVLQKIKKLVFAENPIADLREVLRAMEIDDKKITQASLNAMSEKLDGKLQLVKSGLHSGQTSNWEDRRENQQSRERSTQQSKKP